jgi:hypothetical protein
MARIRGPPRIRIQRPPETDCDGARRRPVTSFTPHLHLIYTSFTPEMTGRVGAGIQALRQEGPVRLGHGIPPQCLRPSDLQVPSPIPPSGRSKRPVGVKPLSLSPPPPSQCQRAQARRAGRTAPQAVQPVGLRTEPGAEPAGLCPSGSRSNLRHLAGRALPERDLGLSRAGSWLG